MEKIGTRQNKNEKNEKKVCFFVFLWYTNDDIGV